VFAFLAEARRRHLKLALASSAAAIKVEYNLREVGLSPSSFDAVVDASDVQRKKPHPDLFLTAAQWFALPPAACLVVEDVVAGVEAAKAVRVELYADGIMGSAPVRQEMKRVRQLAGAPCGYVYSAAVSAARPSADYTARVIPSCAGVAVPLEDARILWQR
jgi:phosphoglycolate phosphatase-like HAD superfamily hydrolase